MVGRRCSCTATVRAGRQPERSSAFVFRCFWGTRKIFSTQLRTRVSLPLDFASNLSIYDLYMALLHIEHIGIAVNDLDEATARYEKLLGVAPYASEEVYSEGVKTVFFRLGDNKIELLGALNGQSPVAQFLEKRGEGIHHIAYRTDDILKDMQRLKAEGFKVLSEQPKDGAENMWVCFVHPKDCRGVLTELCQPKP